MVINRVYLPVDLHEQVQAMADRDERTLSGQLTWLLRQALSRLEETAS